MNILDDHELDGDIPGNMDANGGEGNVVNMVHNSDYDREHEQH